MYIFKITSPMNSLDGSFFKYDKTFASDLYLIYKLEPKARVCISDIHRSAAHVLSTVHLK